MGKQNDPLVIASNNVGKIREIKEILKDIFPRILSMTEAGLMMDVEETGETFQENALIKAEAVCKASGCPALSDDSGLAVDALLGAPGVYSARYCGYHGDDEANNRKLVEELKAIPEEKRTARYECAVVLAYPDGRVLRGHGTCAGLIQLLPEGSGGFGYDPYFYLPQFDCTMAQLPAELKNKISHRRAALNELLLELEQEK